MTFWGLGGARDARQGIRQMERAAARNSLSAHGFLARIYARGDGGWPADAARARRHRSGAERIDKGATAWEKVLAPEAFKTGEDWFVLFW